jgi:hypothetical protein
MRTVEFTQSVQIPSMGDFLKAYPRFSTLVHGPGRALFEAIFQPGNVVCAQIVAELGYPSVLAVAAQCQRISEEVEGLALNDFTKQGVGAAMCTLMEANGFRKTNTKKSVPHKAFIKAEVYVRA